MSQFPINLNLQVSGQNKLQRAITSVKQLEQSLSRIKALDLTKAMGGPTGDKIATLVTKFKGYAKNLEDTNKKQITTVAQAKALQATFQELAANVKVGSGTFMLFNKAAQEQALVVKKLENEYENLIRASKGMQSVEEREAQLARRDALIKKLKEQRREKAREVAERNRNAKAAKREADEIKRLNREKKRERELAERKRGRQLGDLAASVGFPLLFGGGPGAVAGGAAGSIVGGLLGVGFGGQILGSAIGQQLDKLGQAALQTGETFNKLTRNVDQLIPKLGTSTQPGFAGTAQFLVSQGRGSEVATAARNAFERAYGPSAVKRFEELGRTSKEFNQVMAELGVQLQDFISGPLRGFLEVIKKVTGTGGDTPLEKSRARAQEKADALGPRIKELEGLSNPSFGDRQELSALQTQRELHLSVVEDYTRRINGETSKNLTLNKILNDVLKQQGSIQEKQTDLVRTRLTARRDDFARAEGVLAIERAENDLANTKKQLTEEEGRENQDTLLILQLRNQVKEKEGVLDRARLESANNVLTVERAINAEISSLQQATISLFQQLGGTQLAMLDMSSSEEQSFQRRQTGLQLESKLRLKTLELQREQALVGKIEGEVRDGINEKFDLAVRLEKRATELQLERNRQAEILRQNREQEIKDNRELLRLETERNAMLEIRSMDFGRKFELSGAGLGFFGESENFQEETFARSAAQLEAYNEQIGMLQQRIAKLRAEKVDEDIILGQQFKLDDLIAVRDTFKEIQPAIDAAAVAQARFTDAMAVTVPVTDALFTNLVAVVQGTKTAEEAFASFLQSVAKMLMDVATQMIATYMAIGIARAFAGMGPGKSAPAPDIQTGVGFGLDNQIMVGGMRTAAAGAYVGSPTTALIGEGGESEYVIPESKMRESMARYSRGARGSSVIPDAGASGTSGEGGGVAVAAPIDVRYSIERINNIDYVTNDQFQQGLQQAAAQGAQRGEQNTLKRLQMSGSTRRRLGM